MEGLFAKRHPTTMMSRGVMLGMFSRQLVAPRVVRAAWPMRTTLGVRAYSEKATDAAGTADAAKDEKNEAVPDAGTAEGEKSTESHEEKLKEKDERLKFISVRVH